MINPANSTATNHPKASAPYWTNADARTAGNMPEWGRPSKTTGATITDNNKRAHRPSETSSYTQRQAITSASRYNSAEQYLPKSRFEDELAANISAHKIINSSSESHNISDNTALPQNEGINSGNITHGLNDISPAASDDQYIDASSNDIYNAAYNTDRSTSSIQENSDLPANVRSLEKEDLDRSATSFDFGDIIDIINPLQHIPIVSTVYRKITGDEIGPIARIAGGTLFGGPIGAASSVVNVLVEHGTGDDIAGNIYNLAMGKSESGESVHYAASMMSPSHPTGVSTGDEYAFRSPNGITYDTEVSKNFVSPATEDRVPNSEGQLRSHQNTMIAAQQYSRSHNVAYNNDVRDPNFDRALSETMAKARYALAATAQYRNAT
jgi:hypothetical protein